MNGREILVTENCLLLDFEVRRIKRICDSNSLIELFYIFEDKRGCPHFANYMKNAYNIDLNAEYDAYLKAQDMSDESEEEPDYLYGFDNNQYTHVRYPRKSQVEFNPNVTYKLLKVENSIEDEDDEIHNMPLDVFQQLMLDGDIEEVETEYMSESEISSPSSIDDSDDPLDVSGDEAAALPPRRVETRSQKRRKEQFKSKK